MKEADLEGMYTLYSVCFANVLLIVFLMLHSILSQVISVLTANRGAAELIKWKHAAA